jgi:hypothetical protein
LDHNNVLYIPKVSKKFNFLFQFVETNLNIILSLKFFIWFGILVDDIFNIDLYPNLKQINCLFLDIDVDIKRSLVNEKNAFVMALEIKIYLYKENKRLIHDNLLTLVLV